MENKKGSVSTVFLVIAIILIIVMGVLMYMQKREADMQITELENNASQMQETINDLQGKIDNISNTINSNNEHISDKTEENIIKNEDVFGTYEYDVPQKVKDEHGNYYNGITIELLADKKFKYYYGEGSTLEGVFQIENNNIICNAKTIEGEYLNKQEINVKYTFKYSNNTLELIDKEGKVKFAISNSTEIKEIEEVYEEIGSKFIKK